MRQQTESTARTRVLIVEDEGIIAQDLRRRLEDLGHVVVGTASHSAEALRLARESSPGIVLMDITLQGGEDGIQVAEALRRAQDVPVVFLTAHTDAATLQRARNALPYGYLIKPFEPRDLAITIEMAVYRHAAETRMREQAALLDQARDAIVLLDWAGIIRFWNRGAERLYGHTSREALGQDFSRLVGNEATPRSADLCQQVRTHGEWEGECRGQTKAGKIVLVRSRWSVVRDPRGQPKSCLVIHSDITEQRNLERQYIQAQRRESIGALAGGIAHDLNNVLAPILLGSQLLQKAALGEEAKKTLAMIQASSQRGAEMVRQILSLARGAAGEHVTLQLGAVVADFVKLARETLPRSIVIEHPDPGELHPVRGNSTQIHQVLLNLCVNARDAMPSGGTLTIEAVNEVLDRKKSAWHAEPVSGPYVALRVTDNGAGIPRSQLEKIFEPFFTTKAADQGTGLGLSTVLGIVKGHQGLIEVASEPGLGTTFTVHLPAAPGAMVPRPPGRGIELREARSQQVLIVDDECAILQLTREILCDFGYRVLTARDGVEALAVYQAHRGTIDVVVTDMMMPVMDGPTTIDVLRAVNPRVRVIGITGLGSNEALALAAKPKLQAFLRKPYLPEELLAALQKVLPAAGPPGAAALTGPAIWQTQDAPRTLTHQLP